MENKLLEPLSGKIQVCRVCGKVDAYKDDGHDCLLNVQNQMAQEYYD